jgi:hypothetical protein
LSVDGWKFPSKPETEDAMRRALLALMVGCAASATVTMPASARDYRYCIKGCDFGAGLGDCSFSTYQQCQASASGRVATCAENPYFSAKAEMAADRGRMSRRRY